jgi:hypothetical protein
MGVEVAAKVTFRAPGRAKCLVLVDAAGMIEQSSGSQSTVSMR